MRYELTHHCCPCDWPFCPIAEFSPDLIRIRLGSVDTADRKPNDEDEDDDNISH